MLFRSHRRGVPLAEKIAAKIKEMDGVEVAKGTLDITLYRDDLSTVADRPVVNKTELPANITGKTIILVDDVLYTGRTIRAAMDELIDFGRPRRVQLAVLIDRGWRELPIQADYIGKTVTTTEAEIIKILQQALADGERGLGKLNAETSEDQLARLAMHTGGDARTALNTLELAAVSARPDTDNRRLITEEDLQEALQRASALYDKTGEQHYARNAQKGLLVSV